MRTPTLVCYFDQNVMPTVDNKNLIKTFIEEVLNEGQFERLDELVLEDFVELDPLSKRPMTDI